MLLFSDKRDSGDSTLAGSGYSWKANGMAALVLAVAGLLLASLALPLTAAIGPFYWDTMLYYDAAARIADGQIPLVDFLAPVGPLEYWLFALVLDLFPEAQGAYAATWSILIVTAPAMALVVHDVARRSALMAAGLALPFLVFSALPFNTEQFYPYPGIDGFGIYNRHISQILYVLVAVLLFVESIAIRGIVLTVCFISLFLTKITGFLFAVPLIVLAILARRLGARKAVFAAIAFATLLFALEAYSGIISAYLKSIAELIGVNQESLTAQIVHGAADHVAAVGIILALALWLAVADRGQIAATLTGSGGGFFDRIATLAAMPWLWLAVLTIGGILLEGQNWGSQAFIFYWPAALKALESWAARPQAWRVATGVLIAASTGPTFVDPGARALRTFAAQLNYARVDLADIGPLSAVSKRAGIDRRVEMIRETAIAHPGYHADYAEAGELPFFNYYAQPEFQLAWLHSVDEAVAAIRAHEASSGTRFGSILSLNFVNPFPFVLGRGAPRLVTIGADPHRSMPPLSDAAKAELEKTDLVLWPKCPETIANRRIRDIYAAGLTGRETIALSPCWDGYIRAD